MSLKYWFSEQEEERKVRVAMVPGYNRNSEREVVYRDEFEEQQYSGAYKLLGRKRKKEHMGKKIWRRLQKE